MASNRPARTRVSSTGCGAVAGPLNTAPSAIRNPLPLGTDAELDAACAGLAAVLTVPWAEFPRGVEAACRAGASGMLAGRALWSDAPLVRCPSGPMHCPHRTWVATCARPWSG
jgi:hypothetical protein